MPGRLLDASARELRTGKAHRQLHYQGCGRERGEESTDDWSSNREALSRNLMGWEVAPCVEYCATAPSAVKSDAPGDESCPSYSRSGIDYKPYRFRLFEELSATSK